MGTYDKDAARKRLVHGELATEVLSHLQIAAVGDKEDSNYVTRNRCCPVGTLGLWPRWLGIHRQGNGILQQVEKGMQCMPSTWTQRSLTAILGYSIRISDGSMRARKERHKSMGLVSLQPYRSVMEGDLLPYTCVS
jgi:hypothetical protein